MAPDKDVYYQAGSNKPQPKAFELSSEDENQDPPLLSVFDTARTTPDQARVIRKRPESLAFAIEVDTIREISTRLEVVEDPFPADDERRKLPGADGHCGISGLMRPKGEPSSELRNIRRELADACTKI